MTSKLDRRAYEQMISEDVGALAMLPDTVWRAHIEAVLHNSVECYYGWPESEPGVAAIGGRTLGRTIQEHECACQVLIAKIQRDPNFDSHLVSVLCDAVRCAREYVDVVQHGGGRQP